MYARFAYTPDLNGSTGDWDVTYVTTDMCHMFDHASGFSGHDLTAWDIARVKAYDNYDFFETEEYGI